MGMLVVRSPTAPLRRIPRCRVCYARTRSQPLANVYINVCIRDEHESIREHAEKRVGEANTSRAITEALRADVSSGG